jgi:hypothetical protein
MISVISGGEIMKGPIKKIKRVIHITKDLGFEEELILGL